MIEPRHNPKPGGEPSAARRSVAKRAAHARAVRTAWVVAVVAFIVYVAFVLTAVLQKN